MFTELHEQTADDWSADWKHADNEEQTVKKTFLSECLKF